MPLCDHLRSRKNIDVTGTKSAQDALVIANVPHRVAIDATDASVLVTATAIVAVVAWLATAIPARQAARTDPILALRGGA